jgi:hypothetical protein
VARSPRRDATAKRTASTASKERAEPEPVVERAEPVGADIPDPADVPGVQDRAGSGGGIEDVAWAGVAAAAEAATIGVRLATRALEAMRDAVDRR